MLDPADSHLTPDATSPSFLRTAFSHGATYIVGGGISQAIGLVLFPFFAHALAPRDYGIIDLATLAGTLANLTVALEVAQGFGRLFVEAGDPDERQALASTTLIFTVASYTAAAVVAAALAKPLTDVLLGPGVRPTVMEIIVAGIWCAGLLYLTQFALQFQFRPWAFGAVTLVTTAVWAGVSSTLVFGFDVGVIGVLIGSAAGNAVGAAAAFALSPWLYRLRFDREKLRHMLAYSTPLIPSSIGVFLNAYADRLAIRSRLSLADVGIYGAGYRLSLIVSIMLLGLQGAVNPLVLARHAEERTPREVARLLRLFSAAALTVLLLVSLFAPELLHLLTRPAYYEGATVVPFVIAGAFLGGMYVFAPGLNIAKRTKLYGLIVGASGIANAGLAFALVGPLGIRGVAIAFFVACAASFVAVMAFSQRAYPIPYDWPRLCAAAVAITAILAAADATFGIDVRLSVVLAKVGLAGAGIGIVVLLLERDERADLLRLFRRSPA